MRTEQEIDADIKTLKEKKTLLEEEIQKLEQEKLSLLPLHVDDKVEIDGSVGWIHRIDTFSSTGNLLAIHWNPEKKDGSRSKSIRQFFYSKDELNKIKKL